MENEQKFSVLQNSPDPLIGIGELLERSLEIYRRKIGVLFGIAAVPFVFSVILALLSVPLGFSYLYNLADSFNLTTFNWKELLPVFPYVMLFIIFGMIVGLWSELALIYCIKEKNKELKITDCLKAVKNKLFSGLWVSFLVGITISLGVLFFVVPGIVFYIWFQFSVIIFLSEGLKGTKTLSKSKELVKGNGWNIFWRAAALILLSLVFSLIFGYFSRVLDISFIKTIGTILLSPFALIYNFLIYEDLKIIRG